ncbi:MAG TPA: Fic family protein [Prolixibacteraceae bacterium]
MIDIQDVIRIHEILIGNFGGSKGLRDHGLLESAISRPFQTFDKVDLYSNPVEKSAALIESIIINHPFVDGNKRIGYVLMRVLLMEFGFDIIATEEEKYDFVLKIAEGKYHHLEIIEWLIDKIGDNKL